MFFIVFVLFNSLFLWRLSDRRRGLQLFLEKWLAKWLLLGLLHIKSKIGRNTRCLIYAKYVIVDHLFDCSPTSFQLSMFQ